LANRLVEGFDNIRSPTALSLKHGGYSEPSPPEYITGRRGSGFASRAATSGDYVISTKVVTPINRWYFGSAIYLADLTFNWVDNKRLIHSLWSDGIFVGGLYLMYNETLKADEVSFKFFSGTDDTLTPVEVAWGGFDPLEDYIPFGDGAWIYVESKIILDELGSGTVEVWVNGVSLYDFNDLKTNQISSVADQAKIHWGYNSGNPIIAVDDLYINDFSGAPASGFDGVLGPIVVEGIRVAGNSADEVNHNKWVATDGSPNWTQHTESGTGGIDGDLTKVTSNTGNDHELYTMTQPAVVSPPYTSILGVEVNVAGSKDTGASTRVIKPAFRGVSGNNYATSPNGMSIDNEVTSGYEVTSEILEINPVTGLAWDINDLPDTEFGMELQPF
jgi:hypothetical protein